MKQQLNHLQSLRDLAALLVIWHHSSFLLSKHVVDNILGFTGVPLFFMISGFIMVYTTRKHSPDLYIFLWWQININSNICYNPGQRLFQQCLLYYWFHQLPIM